MAEGRLPPEVVDIAHIGVAHALGQGDAPGHGQGRRRRRRPVQHPEVGVEGGEVQRRVGAQALDHPAAEPFDLLGWESFSPGIRRMVISSQTSVSRLQVLERLQHRLQVGLVSLK